MNFQLVNLIDDWKMMPTFSTLIWFGQHVNLIDHHCWVYMVVNARAHTHPGWNGIVLLIGLAKKHTSFCSSFCIVIYACVLCKILHWIINKSSLIVLPVDACNSWKWLNHIDTICSCVIVLLSVSKSLFQFQRVLVRVLSNNLIEYCCI